MIELWKRLLDRLRARGGPPRRYFALEESLHTALERRAGQQQRPQEDVQAELVSAALAHLQVDDWMRECWQTLSPREQEVAALTCLNYTNRQMAGRLNISPQTVKSHLVKILVKFQLHSKVELRQALSEWDFRAWGERQQ